MKEKKTDRLMYYFYRLFGLSKNRKYLVFPNGDCNRVYMKLIPNIIHFRETNRDYSVVTVVAEPINKVMTYYYIKIEELFNK